MRTASPDQLCKRSPKNQHFKKITKGLSTLFSVLIKYEIVLVWHCQKYCLAVLVYCVGHSTRLVKHHQ